VATLERTSYDLALRALGQQEQALTELRARTGTLLTASSLIASFLGAQALDRNGLSVWVVLALAAFGLSVVLSIYVLLPKDGLIFALDAPETYEALYDLREDEEEFVRRLAYWLQSFRQGNHATVRRLTRAFEVAGVALLVEIGFLATALAVG
jgi:hypothetical protein